jgi:hypothetical protein
MSLTMGSKVCSVGKGSASPGALISSGTSEGRSAIDFLTPDLVLLLPTLANAVGVDETARVVESRFRRARRVVRAVVVVGRTATARALRNMLIGGAYC